MDTELVKSYPQMSATNLVKWYDYWIQIYKESDSTRFTRYIAIAHMVIIEPIFKHKISWIFY